MKIILDSNILFSALLKPDGRIAEIILNPVFPLEKLACHFVYVEIFKHKEKLLKISKIEERDFLEILYGIVRKVTFISEDLIPPDVFDHARELVADIDPKDVAFVALSLYLDVRIWSGDKPLIRGLRAKGFSNIISTDELLALLSVQVN